ncbi:MAG: NAD(P)-dependent oxidoreductase [Kiritimatiellae bacterium]|nr:NAD(P)-dependent oxidoreductase [Kiritimatiellia bacterium]
MNLAPILDEKQAAANMAEIEPKYTQQEAHIEAQRCLYCFDAPCIKACPTGIDIPAFIKKIATDNLIGSSRVIFEANPLGASCARVCPVSVLCEGACVMLDRDQKPIKIGRLQRYATDHTLIDNDIPVLFAPEKKNGKKVATIGGGPASLGCAAELAQLGYEVTVYEKSKEAGGLNTYGIAYYKMTPETSIKEVDQIRRLGVKIQTGVEVGKDVSIADLDKNFDAIFIGCGLGRMAKLNVPGEDLKGVYDALDFIEEIHTQPLHTVPVGRRVAVIGCGNTAIDAVTEAKRLGATNAVILYRRGEEHMPAIPYEYGLAKADGCEFQFYTAATEIIGENGRVKAVKIAKTKINDKGRVELIPGSERVEEFDMVLLALGQEPYVKELKSFFPGLEMDKDGNIVRDFATGRTNLPRVYAGGDGANGGREVVNAVAEGKRAARGMHDDFFGEKVVGPVQATRYGMEGSPPSPVGSGFDWPVRAPELEKEYYKTHPRKERSTRRVPIN